MKKLLLTTILCSPFFCYSQIRLLSNEQAYHIEIKTSTCVLKKGNEKCEHIWAVKPNDSFAVPATYPPPPSDIYRICSKCKRHEKQTIFQVLISDNDSEYNKILKGGN